MQIEVTDLSREGVIQAVGDENSCGVDEAVDDSV